MKLSLRIFIVYFFLVGIGIFTFFSNAANQLRPIVRQSAENALIDSANFLAEIAAQDIHNHQFINVHFKKATNHYLQRKMNASIWDVKKISPDMRFYIANLQGIVIFHTTPDEIGKNYSHWLDVSKTLKGEYGARTTLTNPDDELSSTMYVAAPIYDGNDLFGVLTVMQPNASSLPFLEFARTQLLTQGSIILVFALAIGALMTYWLTSSIRKLSIYVQGIRQGERVAAPKLHERELAELAEATENMRKELEGKSYIENYVHTLTHEMKSPLAAIRGAAELLNEGDMDASEQQKFLSNILNSSHRMQDLIDRLLALASIENKNHLEHSAELNLSTVIAAEANNKNTSFPLKKIIFTAPTKDLYIIADKFLLQQAISNLLDNAIDFSNDNSQINIYIVDNVDTYILQIENDGPWIPEYALHQIYNRFYSLPRPNGSGKSSGLGLNFVREVAKLHRGTIQLSNTGTAECTKVQAKLTLSKNIPL